MVLVPRYIRIVRRTRITCSSRVRLTKDNNVASNNKRKTFCTIRSPITASFRLKEGYGWLYVTRNKTIYRVRNAKFKRYPSRFSSGKSFKVDGIQRQGNFTVIFPRRQVVNEFIIRRRDCFFRRLGQVRLSSNNRTAMWVNCLPINNGVPIFTQKVVTRMFLRLFKCSISTMNGRCFKNRIFLTFQYRKVGDNIRVLSEGTKSNLITRVFHRPNRVFVGQFRVFFLRRMGRVRLTCRGRTLIMLIRPFSRFLVIAIMRTRSLVANSSACFKGYFNNRTMGKFKGKCVSVCEPFTIINNFRCNFISGTITGPFIFLDVCFKRISERLSWHSRRVKLKRNLSIRLSCPNDKTINKGSGRECLLMGNFNCNEIRIRRNQAKDTTCYNETSPLWE